MRRNSLVVGILPETKNIWERRAPLTPQDVSWLIHRQIKVEVVSSTRRVFEDDAYRRAGASIVPRIRKAKLLVGVKEPEQESLIPNTIILIFSHTAKGQKENRPLLKSAIQKNITLVDFEHIVDARQQRLVYFGRFAGICGTIDCLHYLGQRRAWEGIRTPLEKVRRSLDYRSYKTARRHLRTIASQIRKEGIDPRLSPFIVGITGHGNVSEGVQEVLDIFNPLEIHPRDMLRFVKRQKKRRNRIYKIVLHREEKFRAKNGKGFYFEEYLEHPERFESNLDRFLPHLNLLMNTSYWDRRYPRLVSEKLIRRLYQKSPKLRLGLIGDLSCDIEGSIEITKKVMDPGNPVFIYNPKTRKIQDGWEGEGIAVLAVDNLPCEFSQEASEEFSGLIRDYIYQIAAHGVTDLTEHAAISREIREAVITQNGRLTHRFKYLK